MGRLLAVVVVLLLVVPAPALAQETGGYLEGSIIDEATGEPAFSSEGVTPDGVNVVDLSGNQVGVGGPIDDDGQYRIGPLPAGRYKLQYVDRYSEYETEWWQDRAGFAEADPVEVREGQTTGGLDFRVSRIAAPGAWIEGQFTIAETGQPVPAGFGFYLYFLDATRPPPPPGVGGSVGSRFARTDADGRYRLGPIPAGTYKVEFTDSTWFAFEGIGCPCTGPDGAPAMLMGWWNGKADFAGADLVEIGVNEVTVLDFSLRQVGMTSQSATGGYIEGLITDGVTGSPIQDVWVDVFDSSGQPAGMSRWTTAEGTYRIGPLQAGSYKLQLHSAVFAEFARGWWRSQTDLARADPVEVVAGRTTSGVDFVVEERPGGWIEGRLIVAETGAPVPAGFRLGINYLDLTGAQVGGKVAWTDDDGRYRMGPIPPGRYKLMFVDNSWFAFEGVGCPCTSSDGSPAMLISWWRDKANFAAADPVEIPLDETIVADFSLRQVGEIPQDLPFSGGGETVPLLISAGVLILAGFGFLGRSRGRVGLRFE